MGQRVRDTEDLTFHPGVVQVVVGKQVQTPREASFGCRWGQNRVYRNEWLLMKAPGGDALEPVEGLRLKGNCSLSPMTLEQAQGSQKASVW